MGSALLHRGLFGFTINLITVSDRPGVEAREWSDCDAAEFLPTSFDRNRTGLPPENGTGSENGVLGS